MRGKLRGFFMLSWGVRVVLGPFLVEAAPPQSAIMPTKELQDFEIKRSLILQSRFLQDMIEENIDTFK